MEAIWLWLGLILTRAPLLLVIIAGMVFAIVRWRRHPRVSAMTVIALVIYLFESLALEVFSRWLPGLFELAKVQPRNFGRAYVMVFFLEDFIFAAVLILLVAAAFTGRGREPATKENKRSPLKAEC